MSKTLNRPLFKRGPDGQMRQAKFIGGVMSAARSIPQVYRAAKFYAPKFTNVPYNINRGLANMGVPTMFGKVRTTGIKNPYVGKTGPMNPNGAQSYDYRLNQWHQKLNGLRNKHNLTQLEASGLKGIKNMPQEVIDHWKAIPRMPFKRQLVEGTAYTGAYNMAKNWMTDHSEAAPQVAVEAGSVNESEQQADSGPGSLTGPTNSGVEPENTPLVPGTNMPDNDGSTVEGDEYDGEGDFYTGDSLDGAAGGPIPDLTKEVMNVDESVNPKSIEDYKTELREMIGKEDNTMGTLLLMQLGLGMMAGKSNQPGFAGFAEILGKSGQQVLPMFMEHMQNKRKEDKEIALAAYDMLREDRKLEAARENDLRDFIFKEDYKFNTWVEKEQYKQPFSGDMGMIQVNNPSFTPSGERIDNWTNLKQTYTKSPEALYILQNSDPNMMRVVNLNMTDAGMKAAGLGDMNLTKAQRGENVMLANTYERNIGQILNFLMDPEIGLHSGQFKTGSTGAILKGLRFLDREVNNAWNTLMGTDTVSANTGKYLWSNLKEVESDMMTSLVENQGLIAGAGNTANEAHGDQKDIMYGTYDDGQGNQITGNFATEAYVRNLTNNQFYDVNEQLVNMMGFLEARLKQPTGRLLADTIKTSIENLKSQGFMTGDPVQIANKMHFFVKRLYEAYATHAIKGGSTPKTVFEGGRGLVELSIPNYNASYLNFVGNQNIDNGINLGWMNQLPSSSTTMNVGNSQGNIYEGQNEVIINAPADFSELMKYAGGGN